MLINRHICLCGFMGAGKSALGYRLASIFRRRFIDLDAFIEQKEGKKIPDIFKKQGEAYFRKMERECILEILAWKDPIILSLGGGSLQDETHLNFIKNHCLLVYINIDRDVLLERLLNDKKRPMLRNNDGSLKSESELKKHVDDMLNERESLYLKSHINFKGQKLKSVVESAQILHDVILEYAG